MMVAPCTACAGSWPPVDHYIADCGLSRAYLAEDQFFTGWTILVLKRHATELCDLTREERGQLIEEVNGLAVCLMKVFCPVKVNYGLLGNQLPHVHWHVIPRLADDPAPRDPVWAVHHAAERLSADALAERIAIIRAALDGGA
jgi:diadenosine tetraphosphate (Ap4A) HIT family hydrolase